MNHEDLALFGGAPAVPDEPRRSWPFYSRAAQQHVSEIVRSGRVYAAGLDSSITDFERGFLARHGDEGQALMMNSGTSALHAAYFGLDLPPGSEVLVPTNTFLATVTPLLLLGLRPVFCGADPVDGTIDVADAQRRVTSRTRAIAVTHVWGQPADMDGVGLLAQRFDLRVVEDCSHVHGTVVGSRPIGGSGDVAVFSLGSRKTVSGGTAGILLTRDRQVYERALLLGIPQGRTSREVTSQHLRQYVNTGFGENYRSSPIAAVLAADHLDRLDDSIRIKNENLAQLARLLHEFLPGLSPPSLRPAVDVGTWYGYKPQWMCAEETRVSRAVLVDALRAEGVPVEIPGALLHRQPLFEYAGPLAHLVGRRPLVDPEDYGPTDAMQARIVSWETKHLYEPADDLVRAWGVALEKCGRALPALARHAQRAEAAD